MKRKPIKIDWEQLEDAFTNHDSEVVTYFDLVTGHVVLEGEGEADEYDDEDIHFNGARIPQPTAQTRGYETRLLVPAPDASIKVEWMKRFVADGPDIDKSMLAALKKALKSDDPANALSDVLNEHAEAREHWYLYRSNRLHEQIESWLGEHEIQVVDAPPWKG